MGGGKRKFQVYPMQDVNVTMDESTINGL
jgi:hypothetical protein